MKAEYCTCLVCKEKDKRKAFPGFQYLDVCEDCMIESAKKIGRKE